jgi:hypothetical protein
MLTNSHKLERIQGKFAALSHIRLLENEYDIFIGLNLSAFQSRWQYGNSLFLMSVR